MLKKKSVPDAFFTANDNAALGVINAAENLGIQVPEDLGVVGFSNEGFSALVKPGISSINQNSKLMGKNAANIYFEELLHKKQKTKTLHLSVPCELIVRASSSPQKKRTRNGLR